MAKFKSGDVVRLTSNKRHMTVSLVYLKTKSGTPAPIFNQAIAAYGNPDELYLCTWINGDKQGVGVFTEGDLELV